MKKIFLPLLIILIPLVGAICWDLYSTKMALEIRLINSITLVEEDPIIEELTILYENKHIKNLTKMQFSLINTGRNSIVKDEIKSPITIEFPEKANILVAKSIFSDPQNIVHKIEIDDTASKIYISFSLLNPTDFIEFHVYFAGANNMAPVVTARIKGIKSIHFKDYRSEYSDKPSKKKWWTWIIDFYAALFILFLPFTIRSYFKDWQFKKEVANNPTMIDNLGIVYSFEVFIKDKLQHLSATNIRKLNDVLENDEGDWDNDRRPMLIKLIKKYALEEKTFPKEALITFIIFAILGVIWFSKYFFMQ